MKTLHEMTTSPSSSSERSTTATTTTTMEERDSCYFPGCRKDANCSCEICLASINATLDLMPISIQKSSLTKLSASSRPNLHTTPISFDASAVSTPRSTSLPRTMESPAAALKSTARLSLKQKNEAKMEKKKNWVFLGGGFWKWVLGLTFLVAVEIGFSWGLSASLRPAFSSEIVKSIGEKSCVATDLSGKLRFLEKELKGFVVGDEKVLTCSGQDSKWVINQEGQVLNSRCVLFKSAMEEVSIWGWPLQASGLLRTGFSSRSFTVLSGRITEWSDGKIEYSIWQANTSWMHKKWSSSAVQLDPNTWVLEYRRGSMADDSSLLLAVVELIKYKMSKVMKEITTVFQLFSVLEEQYTDFTVKDHVEIPT